MSDIDDRLDRLESRLERQRETTENQQETIETQQNRIDDLESDDDSDRSVTRRDAIRAGGVLALLGLGSAATGTASADPQGQVGTETDPLQSLYTEELDGGVTGGSALTDLTGAGLSISSGTLSASGASAWDSDGSGLLMPSGSETGVGSIDTVQSDAELTFDTDGGDRALELGVPTTHGTNEAGGNFVAGHPNNAVDGGLGVVIGGGGRAGGDENTVGANYTTVGGGFNNAASGKRATVGGGKNNEASGGDSTVGGGRGNEASDGAATVGGGRGNTASQITATVSGGGFNTAGGRGSSVPGGRWGRAEDRLSFVWNDGTFYGSTNGLSSSEQVASEPVTGSNTFSVSATGGVRFITGGSSVTYIEGRTTGWSTTSTRTAKTNVDPVDPEAILDGVTDMEVATWEYKDEDGEGEGVTHVGPMAEDFHEVVDVGTSDEHINSVNARGVAFGAIQGLAERLSDAHAELDAKERRIEDLESETERTGDRIDGLEADTDDLLAELDAKEERIDDLESETETLREENDRLRERNAELESRTDRIERQLGIDTTASQQGVADD
jgi:archaellum component FlaC